MAAMRSSGRTRRGRTEFSGKRQPSQQCISELKLQEGPCTHVFGLVLNPTHLSSITVGSERNLERFPVKRVKLLETQYGDVFALQTLTFALKLKVDFATAKQDSAGLAITILQYIRKNALEAAGCQLVQRRRDVRVPQEALRCHHNQRFSPPPQNLPADTMKKLGRHGWLNDLNVVIRSQLKKSFQARAGMLRALAFQSMRKQ